MLIYRTNALWMQIAMDNKDAILASIPVELKEKGSKLYTSLLEEKVSRF
mgnify:CR=1 FL=1|jgi:hypothetical protein